MQSNRENSERYFCDIIQSACPYDHDCNVCRLHNDYEAAREKSAELMEKGDINEVRNNGFGHTL